MFYNLHTHIASAESGVTEVVNLRWTDKVPSKGVFSLGLHPWEIKKAPADWELLLEEGLQNEQIIALGECGLDKNTAADILLQEELFAKQIGLSERYNRPVIIHCVKAWSELMNLKKTLKPTMPWVVHGFRGNEQLADQLLKHGFYLSFGLYYQPEALNKSWPSHFLLETDDREVPISQIYKQTAKDLEVSEAALSDAVARNFNSFFSL